MRSLVIFFVAAFARRWCFIELGESTRRHMGYTLAMGVVLAFSSIARAAPDQAAKLEFFESKIRPALIEHCYQCHSVESGKSKGNLLLDSRAAWQVGGESGPAIIPGNPAESLVIKAISRSGVIPEMPPKSHLPQPLIEDFRQWVADGAVDPREGDAPVHEKETIDIEVGKKFWSFQPRKTFSEKHSIDGFVQPQSPRAPSEKLARRLYLDLTGLPPTPSQLTAFLQLPRDEAVSTTVDQLLAKKEFGEKWARHWLDVARYADSNGGDFNLTFHESWRYRNYVIDAFNNDLPYDQFLREQIAGDLMPFDSPEQRDRQLIATGFLMIAPKMLTERDKPKMYLDIADEQVDTIGRSIMGLTLGCARCHDHKFDPIPTADYYAMAGIFHSTRVADRVLMNNVNVTGWTNTNLTMDAETKALVDAHRSKIENLEKQIAEVKKQPKSAQQKFIGIIVDNTEAELSGPWRHSTNRSNHIGDYYLATDKGNGPYSITWKAKLPKPGKYEVRVSFGGGSGLAKTARYSVRHVEGEEQLIIDQTVQPTIRGMWYPIGQFTFATSAAVTLTDKDAKGYVIADAIQLVHVDDIEKEAKESGPDLKSLEGKLSNLKKNPPKTPQAMAASENTGERLGDLHIRIRGETKNRGALAPRGFLQVASYSAAENLTIPQKESGRLQLAEWLVHPDHPLTARVMVNRIWQQLFGQGIVVTSDNFGTLGASPSHPELLDYLAGTFIAHDWSIKTLIREIINSQAYQQTAQTASQDDPDNLLLRHQNRRPAPAETIRDSILAIAGELDPERYESVVSEFGMYAIQTSGKRHASVGKTENLRQRSIYLPIVRGAVPASLAIFDLPNPDMVTGTRSVTTVPAQALFMMNSPFVQEMANATAARIAGEENASIEDIIQQLYVQILIRDADTGDIATARDYITALVQSGKTRQEAVASFVQVLFSSTEFRFVE